MAGRIDKDITGSNLMILGSTVIDKNKNVNVKNVKAKDVTIKGVLDIRNATVLTNCSENCDCEGATSCPLLPQPPSGKPTSLDGENCISCFEQSPYSLPCRDANENKITFNYSELCADFNKTYSYPPIVNPIKLVLTPDPAYVIPSGQVAVYPVPLPPSPLSLTGKHVLVIGASKGIGKACAERFLSEGANVIGTSRHPECYQPGNYLFPLKKLDIRKTLNVKRFMDSLFLNEWTNEQIDILILCPGIHSTGELVDYTGDEMTDIFDLMVSGYQRCVHFALPHMRHSDETRIISLGSTAGEIQSGSTSVYSMAKRSLQFWNDMHQSQSMLRKARNLVTYEPTFSLVEPGFILTTIGLYEFYKPASVDENDINVRKENYSRSLFQNTGIIAANTNMVAEDIYRIAAAPQPGVRYISDNNTPLPLPGNPTITDLVTSTNIQSADFIVNNIANIFNADDGVAALSVVKTAYC